MAFPREVFRSASNEALAATIEYRRRIDSLVQEMAGWASVIPVFGRLDEYLEGINMQEVKSTVLPAGLVLLCLRDLSVLPQPKQHDYSYLFKNNPEDESKISHALHHVDEHEYNGHKVWVYDLASNSHTSEHTHDRIELERVLYGKVKVNNQIVHAGQTHIVHPGTYHPTETKGEPAIVLCALMDGAGESKNDVHKF